MDDPDGLVAAMDMNCAAGINDGLFTGQRGVTRVCAGSASGVRVRDLCPLSCGVCERARTITLASDRNTGGVGFRANYRCPGGTTLSQTYTVGDDGHSLTTATPDAVAWQCYEQYDPLRTEAWRARGTRDGRPFHCDGDTIDTSGAGNNDYADDILTYPPLANRWLRLAGEAGDSVLTSPGRCDTANSGYLSDWDPADGAPPPEYSNGGSLPQPADGVMSMTVCVGGAFGGCYNHEVVRVVHCGTFLLWQLPTMDRCPIAYCVEPSGIAGANAISSVGTDCQGHWSECTRACESAAERSWTETSPQSGYGLPCPSVAACATGDGGCR